MRTKQEEELSTKSILFYRVLTKIAKFDSKARITNLFRPSFNKTLVLVKSKFRKIQSLVKHNRITITQNPGLIFQNYPKPRFLLNLFYLFFIPA